MINYSVRELECFRAVAEELSFTTASKRLHLAQPPISRHIKALEQRLGATLFNRNKRQVSLTPAGTVFLRETNGLLSHLKRAEEAVGAFQHSRKQRLHVGFVSALLSDGLVSIFQDFKRSDPNIEVTLHDRPPTAQIEALRNGELDIGFVGLLPEAPEPFLEFHLWKKEPLCILHPVGHWLEKRKLVRIEELEQENLAMIQANTAPAFVDFIRNLFVNAHIQPRITQEASRAQAVALMALTGSCIAILPACACEAIPQAQHCKLKDANKKPVSIDLMVATRKVGTRACQQFLETAVAT